MRRRIDVEEEETLSHSPLVRSYRSNGRDETPSSSSTRSYISLKRKGASPASTSSYESLTREEVQTKRTAPFTFRRASNTEVISKTSSDNDIERVQEMELQMEPAEGNDWKEEERMLFEGFSIGDFDRTLIDAKQYFVPALSHEVSNHLSKRRKFYLVPLILALLFISTLLISQYIARASNTVMRKQLIRLLDETHVSIFSEGISFNTRAPCPLVYTFDEEKSLESEHWEKESLGEDELKLLGTIRARICGEGEKDNMVSEVLRGAHVVVFGDHGWYHDWFSVMKGARNRTSSHYSHGESVGVPEGHLLRTLLSGQDMFGNTVNYIKYKITGLQIGPLGVSKRSDRFPIITKFDGCIARS